MARATVAARRSCGRATLGAGGGTPRPDMASCAPRPTLTCGFGVSEAPIRKTWGLVLGGDQQQPPAAAGAGSFVSAAAVSAQQVLPGCLARLSASALTTYTSHGSLPGPCTQTLSWRA